MPGLLEWVCDEIEEVLAARDPEVRRRAGCLSVLTPRLVQSGQMLVSCARRAMWVAFLIAAQNRGVDPPLKYFAALLRKGTWRFPQLIGDSE
jgi:hypothetical protein